ncbi:MAG: aminomethyl-transferring glycine dehydrogenase subunit GcvPA [Candidatus Aminicenantes bacterium]|nr:aminomethyl-transferring glycine dehydrogenase subunit GcvPA [Candidatus Aminicenantes bacterium]
MSYIALSDKDKKEMMAALGISSLDELFCCIPAELQLKRKLKIPSPLAEPELIRRFQEVGEKNVAPDCLSFLGAGAYPHVIPVVVDYLSSRGEFISPYTPYQPEVSQGTLQVVFEFQTLICQLTGMEIANASLYEGASAVAEAVLMAHRVRGKPKVLVPRSLHPQYREVVETYARNLPVQTQEIAFGEDGRMDIKDVASKIDRETSAVVCQSPNFFGVIEDLDRISAIAHEHQALFIVAVAEAASLGLLRPPGACGADIVTGEGQSFGIPLSFGGPYLGFMACKKEFLRQFPGRIAGETRDVDSKKGFVLTLSTREQHIRRERATSNICTNQAWCALRATIFLETMGKTGLRELAYQNLQKANYALDKLTGLKGVRKKFKGPVFNEFVCEFPGGWEEIDRHLRQKSILGGLALEPFYPELKGCALVCVTEVHTREDIDRLGNALDEVLA